MNDIKFTYNDEDGIVTCTLLNKDGIEFIGTALCHLDDMDMYNHRTGEDISFKRAENKAFRYYISNYLNPQIKTLTSLYKNMSGHPRFDAFSFEAEFVSNQIYQLQKEKRRIKSCIQANYDSLKTYINAKEQVYKAIRKQRKAKSQ